MPFARHSFFTHPHVHKSNNFISVLRPCHSFTKSSTGLTMFFSLVNVFLPGKGCSWCACVAGSGDNLFKCQETSRCWLYNPGKARLQKEISASVWPKSIFSFSLRKWLDFSACLLCSHQFEQSMGKELRQFCFKQSGLKPETWVNRPTQIQRARNILIKICRDSNHNSN